MGNGVRGVDRQRIGYVCELMVTADLAGRLPRAYMNPEPQTPDDVFCKTSKGWRTVQVKKAEVRVDRNGKRHYRAADPNRNRIKSDILALVDFERLVVIYKPAKTALPPELPSKPQRLCRVFVETVTRRS